MQSIQSIKLKIENALALIIGLTGALFLEVVVLTANTIFIIKAKFTQRRKPSTDRLSVPDKSDIPAIHGHKGKTNE